MKVSIGVFCVFLLVAFVTIPTDVSSSAIPGALIATKLALTPPAAFAGLITGIIGTVLGAIAVKLHLGGTEDNERKKRSIGSLQQEAEDELNSFLEKVYRDDPSRCLDKLFCTVAYTRSKGRTNFTKVEKNLLEMASRFEDGFVSKRMTASVKAGYGQSDCGVLFDSCPFEGNLMLTFIDAALQQVV